MKLHYKRCVIILLLALLPKNIQAAETRSKAEYGSVEERRIANTILQERANIISEKEDIDIRKKELKTLEEGVDKKLAEIDGKLEELKKLQNKIESLLAEKELKEMQKVKDLAGIYQKMSPVKAALAITGLDEQLAADLLANMKVKAAAKILDQTSKLKTAELSTTFTTLQLE